MATAEDKMSAALRKILKAAAIGIVVAVLIICGFLKQMGL